MYAEADVCFALLFRFLQLFFRAHPAEATRTGYRFPSSESPVVPGLGPVCASQLAGRHSPRNTFQRYSELAARACNYDHMLGPLSQPEIEQHCEAVSSMLDEVGGICDSSLSEEQLVDKKLMESQLRLELVRWREVRDHERDPGFYLPLNPLLYLLPVWGPQTASPPTTPSQGGGGLGGAGHPGVLDLPLNDRLTALLSRLRLLAQSLSEAERALSSPVRIFVETAMEICMSFQPFLETDVPRLCREIAALHRQGPTRPARYGHLLKEIDIASSVAAECVARYKEFLERILPKSSQVAGVGRETYERILRYDHFIDSSGDLLALGERHFAEVKSKLEAVAGEIDPSKSWREITRSVIRPMHPQASELLASYMSEIRLAREHMVDTDLMPSIPEGERVLGFHTPEFLEPFSPFGDFLNPSPFAGMGTTERAPRLDHCERRVGRLMLHSVAAKGLQEEEEETLLRSHDYTFISVIAPHETYPGHHLQALMAQMHNRVLRKYIESTLFYEGWGLYVEQLAYETGFFERKRECVNEMCDLSSAEFARLARLTQLRLQLWRAARVILDVKLNTGELSFEDCREFLQREVMFDARSSKGEAFIYVARPGYAPCYIAGFMQFMKLRERLQQQCSEAQMPFSLKHFHSTVLSKGCIPFKLLELV